MIIDLLKTVMQFDRSGRANVVSSLRASMLAMAVVAMSGSLVSAAAWTRINNYNPQGYCGLMLMMTDGTVMVQAPDKQTWMKLVPDAAGNYQNATWVSAAAMTRGRLNFASTSFPSGYMYPNGGLLVVGGEFSGSQFNMVQNFTNTGEIYDPVKNKWTAITPMPTPKFGNGPSSLVYSYIAAFGSTQDATTYQYEFNYDFWFSGATKLNMDSSANEVWTMLTDGTVLSCDVNSGVTMGATHSQRYDFFQDQWTDAGNVPIILTNAAADFQMGPITLLPNGHVIQFGGNENTAKYVPDLSGGNAGYWVHGPNLPNGMGADNAPGVMLPNGHFYFLADHYPNNSPTLMYDYNYLTNTITDITSTLPAQLQFELQTVGAYQCHMLILPNGQLLLSTARQYPWLFTPTGTAPTYMGPTVNGVQQISTGSYYVFGSRINGISAGAAGGGDSQVGTNWPIVKLTKGSQVTYARTTYWNPSVSLPSDNSFMYAEFSLPLGFKAGTYQVNVIANGAVSPSSGSITFVPPAVTASFANNTLTITGDDLDNSIIVTYTPVKNNQNVITGGSITVTANDQFTLVNGGSSATFTTGSSRFLVNTDMKGGNDSVSFNSLYSTTSTVALGTGADSVSFNYCSITTVLNLDGGSDSDTDTVTYLGSSIAKKNVTNIP